MNRLAAAKNAISSAVGNLKNRGAEKTGNVANAPNAANAANANMSSTPNYADIPTYTAADKAKEIELDMEETKELQENSKIHLEKRRVKAMERMAKSNLKLFMLAFLKDLSPYIVLAFVILLIISASKGGAMLRPLKKIDAKRKKAFARAQSKWQRLKRWIKTKLAWLIRLLTPSYRVRLFLKMFTPFGGKSSQIPRQRIMSGRCDNHRWIQITDKDKIDLNTDGKRGYCFSSIRPEDIEWELDVSKMPDYNDLPQQTRKNMQSKMKIIIPFDKEDSVRDGNTFFVPRCDKAYYKDAKDAKGKPVPASLLEDTGTTCKLASYPFVKGSYSENDVSKGQFINKKKW